MKAKGLPGFLWSSEEGGEGADMGGGCAGRGMCGPLTARGDLAPLRGCLGAHLASGEQALRGRKGGSWNLSARVAGALTGALSSPQSHLTDGGTEASENPAHFPSSQSGRAGFQRTWKSAGVQASSGHGRLRPAHLQRPLLSPTAWEEAEFPSERGHGYQHQESPRYMREE